jgi:hypothetical protein
MLVLAGGVFAGYATIFIGPSASYVLNDPLCRLTLGLMGLDELHLRVLATSSEDPREKLNAQTGVRVLLNRPECYCAQRRFIQS